MLHLAHVRGGCESAQYSNWALQCSIWPYEHLSPTQLKPITFPKKWPKGHKHELEAVKRQQAIAKNMENMPKLIAEAKV